MIRVFTAIRLPEDIKRSLTLLKGNLRGAKWVSQENLHITLRFIGEVTEKDLQGIKEELRNISFYPFKLKLKDLGHFSAKSTPRVLWVGVDPKEEILELKERIDTGLLNLNIPRDKKKYVPHVTLARFKGSNFEEVAQYLQAGLGFFTREFELNEMVLFSSKTKEDEPQYSIEEIFPF